MISQIAATKELHLVNPALTRTELFTLNNELVATELVRTLCGTIGILLSMPLATVLTVWWVKRKQE